MKLLRMTFLAAMRALRRNKMRSSLTILGMVIGVAAVITTVGIGQGATRAIENQIASMGTNLLVVMPGTMRRGGAHSGWGGASTLTLDDARAIERDGASIVCYRYVALDLADVDRAPRGAEIERVLARGPDPYVHPGTGDEPNAT